MAVTARATMQTQLTNTAPETYHLSETEKRVIDGLREVIRRTGFGSLRVIVQEGKVTNREISITEKEELRR